MTDLLSSALAQDYMPHGMCYLWESDLVWLHVISDGVTTLAYWAIPFALVWFVLRAYREVPEGPGSGTRPLPYDWMFVSFGIFIVACGATHAMGIWTIWEPRYWLEGSVKAVTALASIATAIALPPLVPRAIDLMKEARESESRRLQLEVAHAELAEAHQELEEMYERVREADRAKSVFLANVSHELRTPITLILGPAEHGLGAEGTSEEDRERFRAVRRNALQLSRRVDDLLQVARLETSALSVTREEADVSELVGEVAEHFRDAAASRGLGLELDIPASMSAELDPGKTERILFNLFANALKFTPEGGTIRCSARFEGVGSGDEGEETVVEVADSGPGVPPDLREAVFERFRQGRGGAERPHGGTGLGLALGRELAELQGGSLSVHDAPEGGALFRLRLPRWAPDGAPGRGLDSSGGPRSWLASRPPVVADHGRKEGESSVGGDRARPGPDTVEHEAASGSEDHGPEPVERGPEGAGEKAEILVVEDNLELREFLADALSEEYHVRAAASGREGLEAALAAPPDLVLTDVMMPEFGGDRLVRALREKHGFQDLPIIVLTAFADDDTATRLLREGATDYVRKPVSLAELRARISNHLEVGRALRLLRRELSEPRERGENGAAEEGGDHGDVVKRVHGTVPEETGGTLSHLLEELAERKRDLEEAIDRNRRLLRELHHRVRGNLQTIDSMVSMQLRRQDSQDGREALSRVRDRIAAIGIVHRMLYTKDRLDRIDLAPFLTELVGVVFRSHGGQERRIRKTLDLDNVEVDAGDAVACGIAVQELVSNALEHAFPGDREGVVEVSVRRDESGEVVLRVADCGIGLGEETGAGSSGPGSRGLGFEIVQALVTQIDGLSERRSEPGEGVEVRIAFTPEVDRKEAPV